jgi:hypothetical protein
VSETPHPGQEADEVEAAIAAGFEPELRACAELESFAVGALQPWKGRAIEKTLPEAPPNADEILALLFARSTKTYKAVLALCRRGYGEQAAMLNRSLFESMAVAHWVAKNEEAAAERFLRGWRFDSYLMARALENTGWLEEEAPAPGPELTDEELAEMKADFGPYGNKLWSGHSGLRALVEEIEADWGSEDERQMLRNFLRIVNRDNNQLLHSTVSGLAEAATRIADGGIYLSVGPSTARIERGLFAAYWPYANTLGVFLERFEIPGYGEFEELLKRHGYDFRRLSAEEAKGVGRNDECPCESGKKFKHCHEGRPLAGAID